MRESFDPSSRSLWKLGLMFCATVFSRLLIVENKIKFAQFLRRIFEVAFTLYRLSTVLLFRVASFLYENLKVSMNKVDTYEGNSRYECGEDTGTRWSNDIPDDIMQNVLLRLRLSEFFICGAVCVSWKAVVDRAIATKSCRPTRELPWLMIGSHPFSTKDNGFLRLTDDEKLFCSLPDPTYNMKRGNCVGSIDGWLIMADSAVWRPEGFMEPWSFFLSDHQSSSFPINFFFLNPFTGARVMLPSSSNFPCNCPNGPGFFLEVTASSVPTSPNCFVVSMCSKSHLAFCRPTEESWTLIDSEKARGPFYDIEIIDGKIYAATWEASKFLLVLDIQYTNGNPSYTVERLIMVEPCPNPIMDVEIERVDGVQYQSNANLIALVKDSVSEDLFMIFCRINFAAEDYPFRWDVLFGGNYIIPPQIQGFRVFKMERKSNGPHWVEVFDLGDSILFMAFGGSKMVCASSFLDYNGLYDQVFKRNNIYFAYSTPCLASPSEGKRYGVFSMKSRSIKPIALPMYYSSSQLSSRPVWFTPNPWSLSL